MQIGSLVAIYFIIWWLCLFTVLPFGVRSQVEAGEVVPGSEPGAPVKPRWGRILGITTAMSFVWLAIVWWFVNNYWMV